MIETLDRMSLAKALVRAADKHGSLPSLLVQVNTGEEKQKSGVRPSQLPLFLSELKKEYNIKPAGLMCIPPIKGSGITTFLAFEEANRRLWNGSYVNGYE